MKAEKENPFELDFDSYIRQGEPDKKEKSIAWAIATGLQQVDGLTPSKYLYETARRNIEGEITIEEARTLVDRYYEAKKDRNDDDDDKEEADKVAARIVQALKDKTFDFSPDSYIHIHEKIFEGVFKFAGKIRAYNITKKEWVLDGDTVYYSDYEMIQKTLDYDFAQEKNFDYNGLSKEEKVKHFTRFIANIWQIHPFSEGNTRTTAVFAIKYLKRLGYNADNLIFEKNSWYFRNALVRANYSNSAKGIYMDTSYLEALFRNIMLDENNDLKNRYTHIRYSEQIQKSSEKKFGEKQKSSEKTSKIILSLLKENPKLSAKKLSESIGISSRAVEKQLASLVQKRLLRREGSPKGGHWEILK